MSNLANQYISSSYQSVLNVGTGSGDYLTSTLKPITDGFGTVSPLSLSTTQVGLNGTVYVTGSIIPQGSGSFSLGSLANPWLHGYFSSASIYLDGHPILQLDETNNTTIKGPGDNNIIFLNNITLDADPSGSTYVGGTFSMIGRGANRSTNTTYDGDFNWLRTNGNIIFQNVTGNTDTTSTGSIAMNLSNGGSFIASSDSGSINLGSTIFGNINLTISDPNTGQYEKYITMDTGQLSITSQDGSDIGINNTKSGSIFIDARNYESGSEVYRGNVEIFGTEILNNGSVVNEGSLTSIGNFIFNTIQNDYSGSGVQYGGWSLAVSSSVDGTFAGTTMSDQNSGSFPFAPSIGFAKSSYQGTEGYMDVPVPVYYSGDLNGAGSDVLMISKDGLTTIYRDINISGSLQATNDATVTGSLTVYAGSLDFISPFADSVINSDATISITSVSGSIALNSPVTASLIQSSNGDVYINGSNYDYSNLSLYVSESLAPNIFTSIAIHGSEYNELFGLGASTYNTQPDFTLSYNFYGPGIGNHYDGDFGYDNVVFQMLPTGSNVVWYRDLEINAALTVDSTTSMYDTLTLQGSANLVANGNIQYAAASAYNSGSVTFTSGSNTAIEYTGVDLAYDFAINPSSNASRIWPAHSGVYNFQFSAQFLASSGAANVWVWLGKNGSALPNTTTRMHLTNNEEAVMALNWLIEDGGEGNYYEIMMRTNNSNVILLGEAAFDGVPAIPSIITTVCQVR